MAPSVIHIFFSDLHIGGSFDYRSFERFRLSTIRIVRGWPAVEKIYLYVLGDITDYQGIYRNQVTFLRGLWQLDAAAQILYDFVSSLAAVGKVEAVYLLPGNHDRRIAELADNLELLRIKLERFIESRWGRSARPPRVEQVEEGEIMHVGERKVALYHMLVPRSSGSYSGGITPRILAAGFEMLIERGCDMIICGHHHVAAVTPRVTLLPSFQYSKDPKFWRRGGLLLIESGGDVISIPVLFSQGFYREADFFRDLMMYYFSRLSQAWGVISKKTREALEELYQKYGEEVVNEIIERIWPLITH